MRSATSPPPTATVTPQSCRSGTGVAFCVSIVPSLRTTASLISLRPSQNTAAPSGCGTTVAAKPAPRATIELAVTSPVRLTNSTSSSADSDEIVWEITTANPLSLVAAMALRSAPPPVAPRSN